ncbi:ABC transporter substrate-binding protein [Rhodoferax sp. AJA081-3]|uniref:ABC transporter substrate-binding protein n=1 Tax=Rhodoferax sp. AJA081-3 TaxID=2752316 RepID=UPI001AE0B642|nr:ABC transporter substrate-binding protein [Rhodoferax sp. AJA081-3]QTN27110.1 ABC transporter substrate-binding protein [Rhodoferax sp. AJA081-3]
MLVRRTLSVVASLVLWSTCTPALAAPEAVVIGQSLPLTGAGFPVANRVLAGAKAQVERVNTSGGISGRPLELVTLDDGGDPQRLATNLRTLVRQHGAVLIANCLGERACQEAAQATRELRVPLVGPMSGALQLRGVDVQHVFSTRPDDTREADALVRQLLSIGIHKVAVLSDDSEPARTDALVAALQRAGQQVTRTTTDLRGQSLAVALQASAQSAPQALVISLGYAALDALDRLPPAARAGVPLTIATLSSAGLTQLTRLFRDRVIGYTSVVPPLDVTRLALVRALQRDADAFIGPEAVTFEGLEAYINLRVCTEALRRAGPRADGQRLNEALESLGALDLGGFRLVFGRDRHHGSDYVEIGMRARDGRTLR